MEATEEVNAICVNDEYHLKVLNLIERFYGNEYIKEVNIFCANYVQL